MGDAAPQLNLGTILQGDRSCLKPARARFIEFWAASCPACVANIPHVNELARAFKNSPIDFLSINSSENAELIRRFLQAHPMEGIVAADGVAADGNDGGLISSASQLESEGVNLRAILSYAFDVQPFHILLPDLIAKENYALQVWVPQDSAQFIKPLMQSAVRATGAINVRKERRRMDVLLLEGMPVKLMAVAAATLPQSKRENDRIEGNGISLDMLQHCIEQVTGKSVFVRPESKGRYLLSLTWEVANPRGFETALQEHLGLSLKATKRSVDVLIVEPIGR